MIKLKISLVWPGCAQGEYTVRAKGMILAALRWGNAEGPLGDWGPIAYVPVDPAGNGSFFFPGRRGIPDGATHVWARCWLPDFSAFEDVSAEIPAAYLPEAAPARDACRFSILTDLHLATRPWKIRQALRAAESDTIFLLGDATNDGRPEQFEAFRACVEAAAPDKTIFPVTGNHDVPARVRGAAPVEGVGYADFQRWLLARAVARGHEIAFDPEGRAYTVRIGPLEVIGLQCVTAGRKFLFPEGRQLDWLEERLRDPAPAWRILLCHAPLLAHNPNRSTGQPYLDRNRRLQALLDSHGRIIFLSGHTHVSPNCLTGNAEYDEKCRNIYLDCGSVVATDTAGEQGMMSPDWKDGCVTELAVSAHAVEIRMRSIESGRHFPRGYYRFTV